MRTQLLSTLTLAAAGALACSESTAPKAGAPVSLSFSATSAGATLSRSTDPSLSTSTVDALVITKAQLVLARVELVRSGATCTSETVSGDDDNKTDDNDCAELELGPTIVDLPVSGNTMVNAVTVTIPEGSYSSLEARLRPIRASNDKGKASNAFLTAHPDLDGTSVLVEGTFNGTKFTYKGGVSAGIERQFSPPLSVTSAPLGITVNADLATWFRNGATGSVIDPATANAGGADAQLVADNIRRSFKAFRDNDHNGHDDDGPNHP